MSPAQAFCVFCLFLAEFNQFCFNLFCCPCPNSSFSQLSIGEWRMLCLKVLIAVLLPLFCYSHTYRTTSVVVALTYAGFILISFTFVDVELMVGKAERLVWVPVVTRQGDHNCARCLLVGISSEMASSRLGLEKQEICSWVLMGLAVAGQEKHFRSHTLAHNNDSDWHWTVIY